MSEHAPLIIDVAGLELSQTDCRRLAHPLVGGVILFTRNWENRAQLQALTADIKAVRRDLLICVDHEGGRVQRFQGDGFTHIPPMRAFTALWQDAGDRAINAATAAGFVLGSELRACGVDFSFTPVLDLDWGHSSVIGDRAFHRDPYSTATLARALMHGLLQAGMGNCGKHFPGHGFVAADSHTALPIDSRNLTDILAEDAAPYVNLSAVLTAVMPAHVVYTEVDERPAGFSRIWLQDILRQRMHFHGAIISDDLSMEAARRLEGRTLSHTEAALEALHAGCDVLLLCNQSMVDAGLPLDTLLQDLSAAQQAGHWQARAHSEQRRLALLPCTCPVPWDALRQKASYQEARELLP